MNHPMVIFREGKVREGEGGMMMQVSIMRLTEGDGAVFASTGYLVLGVESDNLADQLLAKSLATGPSKWLEFINVPDNE